ncbi:Transposable element Tcb2 transposase [Araneus ventricosus]|uniref:Transposable element Tcb2 transposase n=1 Tax=Araneus ventricosus TaxID=182803 RepID=A0A4Y2H994_ARAVE|nr:Transposable element Tcb2 transposase [Araneus ventricosus]
MSLPKAGSPIIGVEVIIDLGFRSRRTTIAPLLTARHKALCIAWVRQHSHWTVDDWKHAAWSDESRFQLYRADGSVRVWRKPQESMDPTCQQGTVKSGGASVMVWGLCNWSEIEPLIRLETALTGGRYVTILYDHQHPFMSIVHSDGFGQFQQDNARPPRQDLLLSGSRNTFMTSDISIGHPNLQT